ncbi:MAG: glycosyltransferase family 87 protein, partial [Planctomycetota bacterium]
MQFQLATMKKVRQGKPTHKGAMARWRMAVDGFWEGKNVYARDETPGMHPNTPFTVILLTPLTAMPVEAMTLTMNVAKVLAILACILMLAQLAGHRDLRVCDWVLALGALWAYHSLLADFQHGNTNIFVLFLIVLHLWLFRRGQDLGAGVALALAICLKMTPALFVLYWVYQRNWRLLLYTAAAGIVCVVLVPLVALGATQYELLMGTWLRNMILPGLVKGAWYPIHINQSLSGYVSRLFLTGANGDVFFNPDDSPDYTQEPVNGFITLVSLSPATVKMLLRLGQIVIVGL